MGRLYNDIAETIGHTPLVKLNKTAKEAGCLGNIYLKLEFFNPLSSVKDRIGFAMIDDAQKAGQIIPGKTTLVEPTSGNTGIALAFVAAARGFKIILTMPETMSQERIKLLKVLGAKIVLTEGAKGMKGAIERAEQIVASTPDAFMPQQFMNPSNPAVHERTTGPEIWDDTDGKVDIVVCGVGTGGTITGAGRYLKGKKSSIQMVAVEPETSQVLAGKAPGKHRLQGIGAGFVPEVLETSVIDEVVPITEEDSQAWNHKVCQEEGIPLGISSGAIVAAAVQLAKRAENDGKMVVAVIPSSSERYLSTWMYASIDAQSDEVPVGAA